MSTKGKKPVAAAERMRLLRTRRRNGLRCLRVTLADTEIDCLVEKGFLKPERRHVHSAIQSAIDDFICHALGQTRPLRYSLSFCGQPPALGAKPLVEGWGLFGVGRPRSRRKRPRGPSFDLARRWHLGRT
jgi:hypothetical protein